jgi:hypothetical protein
VFIRLNEQQCSSSSSSGGILRLYKASNSGIFGSRQWEIMYTVVVVVRSRSTFACTYMHVNDHSSNPLCQHNRVLLRSLLLLGLLSDYRWYAILFRLRVGRTTITNEQQHSNSTKWKAYMMNVPAWRVDGCYIYMCVCSTLYCALSIAVTAASPTSAEDCIHCVAHSSTHEAVCHKSVCIHSIGNVHCCYSFPICNDSTSLNSRCSVTTY